MQAAGRAEAGHRHSWDMTGPELAGALFAFKITWKTKYTIVRLRRLTYILQLQGAEF